MAGIDYFHELEAANLAPWATRAGESRGRRFHEERHPYRTEFQRDRDRIIHTRAFRRLEYKTQVFINHEGDHYRTRLTHSIEVAQIARTIARSLRLNEDLTESIALAHDLGHTPFGHTGERILNTLMRDEGGFEHNIQSLRVVDKLEHNYRSFDGLNLTWETREGIIKHSSSPDPEILKEFNPGENPSLEAQIIDLADEIAYNNHDLDDGIRSGLLKNEDVETLTLWQMARLECGSPGTGDAKIMNRETIRKIINILVSDLLNNTKKMLSENHIETLSDVQNAGKNIVAFSEEIAAAHRECKKFLRERLYRHYRVTRVSLKAEKIVDELFQIYSSHPDTLPDFYQAMIQKYGARRTAADYIAGMTDRFALEEHTKLTDPRMGL